MEEELALVHQRLDRIESSHLFRFQSSLARFLYSKKKVAGQLLLHSPFHPLYLWIFRPQAQQAKQTVSGKSTSYGDWLAAAEASLPSADWHRQQSEKWAYRPKISILVPTFRPKRMWLERAIASVKAQSYQNWQLCICDDASGEPWVHEFLSVEAETDPRIRITFSETNGGIALAMNEAGKLATGEYIGFLDHDDELHPYALHYVVEACQSANPPDLLYTDEDYLDPQGHRASPTFKPDWSPELLNSCMYIGHLLVASRQLIDGAGWFRGGFDGAQDYDLALRLAERAREVRHIDRVLYHWRQHPQSTSLNPSAKPYAHEAGRRALTDALGRRHIDGKVEDGPLLYTFHIRRPVPRNHVALVISPVSAHGSSAFLEHLRPSLNQKTELILLETPAARQHNVRLPSGIPCRRIGSRGASGWAALKNAGAEAADADFLVFIDDTVKPINPDWLEILTAHVDRPDVGVAGAYLQDTLGTISHAGVVIGMNNLAGNPGRGSVVSELMYYLQLPRDVSAVSGACFGISRELFQEMGGFDAAFPEYYFDLDLCLRVRAQGRRVILDPRIRLISSLERNALEGAAFTERQRFRLRWTSILAGGDPYYPRVFDRSTEEIRLVAPASTPPSRLTPHPRPSGSDADCSMGQGGPNPPATGRTTFRAPRR
jgi:GT2 family glycosyltransferase